MTQQSVKSDAETDHQTVNQTRASESNPALSGKGTGFFSVVMSILAAGLGVQSRENRERDFQHGKPIHFIIGGLLGTLVFILILVFVVKALLAGAS